MSRRGNYSAVLGLAMPVLLGFTALAFDISMLRLADSQAQDIADAAAHGALIALRGSGDQDLATAAANTMMQHNEIVGGTPSLDEFSLGIWEDDAFVLTAESPNAVQVTVSRDVPFAIAPFMGFDSQQVTRSATAAARPVHVTLVIDITNSWSQANFAAARDAAVVFFDEVADAYGPDDRIGMVVFTGRYGIEHTPLTLVGDAIDAGHRDIWANLGTASKAGIPDPSKHRGCNVYGGDLKNDFSIPVDGCFPQMWREYLDENGTDHTTGIQMAREMFNEHDTAGVYRAAIVLTDGNPAGVGGHNARGNVGYDEDRWRYFMTPESRDTADVKADAATIAAEAWTNEEIHLWAVSFVADATWMEDVIQGDGYYVKTSNSTALSPIFADIAESLPVALVQ